MPASIPFYVKISEWEKSRRIWFHVCFPIRSFLVHDFLAKNRTTVLEQPPYSPDLAPCDFFLFNKLKESMRDHHLGSVEAIKEESARILNAIPKSNFQKCFASWKNVCSGVSKQGETTLKGIKILLSDF